MRSPMKPSSEPTGQSYGLRSDWREHRRMLKYSVSRQTIDFAVDFEQQRTLENVILAEGVSTEVG